jgi:hypothetical protein
MDAALAFGNTTVNTTHGELPPTGVPRLGIASFNYVGQGSIYRGASNGCNLGCCTGYPGPCRFDRPGPWGTGVTVFPQGTGVAATFDAPLVFVMGVAISNESRAMMRVQSRSHFT